MPDLVHWTVFLSATIVLLLLPGPSVMYVAARGIDGGSRAVLLSSVGLALGDLLQVLVVAAGLSTLLVSSLLLFSIVKYGGAAYLIVLGLRSVHRRRALARSELAVGSAVSHAPARPLILQAFSALNPKTALFFAALFPQVVASDAGPAWLQVSVFGVAFVTLGFMTNSTYGCLAGRAFSGLARRSDRFRRTTEYVSGGTLITLGAVSALTPTPNLR